MLPLYRHLLPPWHAIGRAYYALCVWHLSATQDVATVAVWLLPPGMSVFKILLPQCRYRNTVTHSASKLLDPEAMLLVLPLYRTCCPTALLAELLDLQAATLLNLASASVHLKGPPVESPLCQLLAGQPVIATLMQPVATAC